MVTTSLHPVKRSTRRRRHSPAVLRPGIVAFCRDHGYSRQHVTEVLRGERDGSARLLRLLAARGLERPTT